MLSFLFDIFFNRKNQAIAFLIILIFFTKQLQKPVVQGHKMRPVSLETNVKAQEHSLAKNKKAIDKRHRFVLCALSHWPHGSFIDKVQVSEHHMSVSASYFGQHRPVVSKGFCGSEKVHQQVHEEKKQALVHLWYSL